MQFPSRKQNMKILKFLLPALLAASGLPARAAELTGDQILRQMSERLASAQSFSFEATREIDAALLPGIALAGKVRIAAIVQRPDKLAVHSLSKGDSRQFIADGRTLTVFDAKQNYYAVVPMHKTIDALIDVLDTKYGFTPPLTEFALSNPYQEFRRQADSITFLGRAKTGTRFLGIGGIECDHLMLKGPAADAEIWIGVRDRLPHKLVATFHRPGRPRLQVDFLAWNLAPHPTSADFTFTPPKGARKIEMWTTEKMRAARKH